jgi:hypothetical protein
MGFRLIPVETEKRVQELLAKVRQAQPQPQPAEPAPPLVPTDTPETKETKPTTS